jgi:hypothetical protein
MIVAPTTANTDTSEGTLKRVVWTTLVCALTCSTSATMAQGTAGKDTSFHAMQMRGRIVMGVDQYTSIHKFEDLSDGGRIELQRDVDDAEGVAAIRRHLTAISKAFAQGDFSAPAMVHMKEVPGAAVMASRKGAIRYTYKPLARGGELRIQTADAAARAAIHAFLAFQRTEHLH